ncbi:MAG: acyl-CoA desaturase [Acidimicrobiales bacterium]
MPPPLPRSSNERVNWVSSIPFLAVNLLPLLAFVTGVTTKAVVMLVVLYAVRMFAITAGYHRYFAHRTYKTSRPVQAILAFLGTTAAQKGPLWWAGHHRAHHRYSDTTLDIHSPQKGFWWSHVGWILSDKYSKTDVAAVPDLAKFPELVWLDKHDAVGPWLLGIAAFLVGGWSGLIVGFFGSTVLLWHATFTVNSLNHVWGTRRYATSDTSRNNLALALLTSGEGWHNNHHHYQASARQGFFWWEIDPTWYGLRVLRALRLVSDLKEPSAAVLRGGRVRDGSFDLGMFRASWAKASAAVSASGAAASSVLDTKRLALHDVVQASMHAAEDLTKAARTSARAE